MNRADVHKHVKITTYVNALNSHTLLTYQITKSRNPNHFYSVAQKNIYRHHKQNQMSALHQVLRIFIKETQKRKIMKLKTSYLSPEIQSIKAFIMILL